MYYRCQIFPDATTAALRQYVNHVLSHEMEAWFDVHIMTCPKCQEEMRRIESTILELEFPDECREMVLSNFPIPPVSSRLCLTNDEISSIVAGSMSDQDLLSCHNHILECERCLGIFRSLKATADTLFAMRDERDQT